VQNLFSVVPTNQVTLLKNVTCPYCGVELTQDNNNEEHVIGRKFIPKGFLNGQWNLILRACKKCNSDKSELENDISAITLAGRIWFDSDEVDKSIVTEAHRKIKGSKSKKTGKLAMDSQVEKTMTVPFFNGGTLNFNLVSAPQVEDSRSFELAKMQMMAFFYFITFNDETKKDGFWQDGFHPVSKAHHGDWGNAEYIVFMQTVVTWEPCWVGITANGFFKSIIRRHPYKECWSWALEWNKNYRLIGFFGDREPAQAIVNTFPSMEMTTISKGDKSFLRLRRHVMLDEKDDLLFVWND